MLFWSNTCNFNNMKIFLLLLLLSASNQTIAQDTTFRSQHYTGGMSYIIAYEVDTFYIRTYLNGDMESKIGYSVIKKLQPYTRYYQNGRIMWEKQLDNSKANGKGVFFNMKGKRVAEFNFKNDSIVDTVFLSKREHIVMGKITYKSVVYGGMMREDGTSNISKSEGPRIFSPMYAVKLDSTRKEQETYQSYITDNYGFYFLCLEKGSFGFFPSNYDIKLVSYQMGTPRYHSGRGMDGGWNLPIPLLIEDNFTLQNLHYSSVGYAP